MESVTSTDAQSTRFTQLVAEPCSWEEFYIAYHGHVMYVLITLMIWSQLLYPHQLLTGYISINRVPLAHCLGLDVDYDITQRSLHISKHHYVDSLIKKYQQYIANRPSRHTPQGVDTQLSRSHALQMMNLSCTCHSFLIAELWVLSTILLFYYVQRLHLLPIILPDLWTIQVFNVGTPYSTY